MQQAVIHPATLAEGGVYYLHAAFIPAASCGVFGGQIIKTFLAAFIIAPFDGTIAERAASLRRFYRLLLPDAGIAATALEYAVPLVTRDRIFRKVGELTVISI